MSQVPWSTDAFGYLLELSRAYPIPASSHASCTPVLMLMLMLMLMRGRFYCSFRLLKFK